MYFVFKFKTFIAKGIIINLALGAFSAQALAISTSMTLNRSATNAYRIPTFEPNLGFLESVNLTTNFNGSTSIAAPHTHSVSPSPSSYSTSIAGSHSHSFIVPTRSSNGLTLSGFSGSTSFTGGHNHNVLSNQSLTSASGSHGHSVNAGRSYSFGSSQLTSFIGTTDFFINVGTIGTSTVDSHSHFGSSGQTSFGGTHNHTINGTWNTTTTFFYDSNEAPIAESGGLYFLDLDLDAPLIFDASASFDPNSADSIVFYEWDLDDDGLFDFNTTNPILLLSNTQYAPFFPEVGTYDLSLRVTDSLGLKGISASTLEATAAVPFEFSPTIGTLLSLGFLGTLSLRKKGLFRDSQDLNQKTRK